MDSPINNPYCDSVRHDLLFIKVWQSGFDCVTSGSSILIFSLLIWTESNSRGKVCILTFWCICPSFGSKQWFLLGVNPNAYPIVLIALKQFYIDFMHFCLDYKTNILPYITCTMKQGVQENINKQVLRFYV